MSGLNTVFAVIPAGAAAESAVAAYQALPLGANARLVGLHVAPLAITYGLATDMALASFIEAQMAAGNSINHLVDAAEVADVVAFLCSPRSRAINGDAIAAGGGAPRSIHY